MAELGPTKIVGDLTVTGRIKDEAWNPVNFQNGWTNYGSAYDAAGYFKSSDGIVHLKGLVRSGNISTTMFNLPIGYRPSEAHLFLVMANAALARVNVRPNGNVEFTYGSTSWVELNSVRFRVAQ